MGGPSVCRSYPGLYKETMAHTLGRAIINHPRICLSRIFNRHPLPNAYTRETQSGASLHWEQWQAVPTSSMDSQEKVKVLPTFKSHKTRGEHTQHESTCDFWSPALEYWKFTPIQTLPLGGAFDIVTQAASN